MAKLIDLTGQKFGDWTVLEYVGNRKWKCRCSCGTERIVNASSMKSGKSTNCGDRTKHIRKQSDKSFVDLTGQTFGVLNVVKYIGQSRWLCQCNVCGATLDLLSKNIRKHEHIECTHVSKNNTTTTNTNKTSADKNSSNMIGFAVGDIKVISKTGDDRYMCKCICGAEKEIRGYSLRHPKTTNSYKCNHKVQIGQRFGKLIVIDRHNQNCICKCDCGNTKEVWINNLLNNSIKSCGCIKKPTYTKDDIIYMINEFKKETGYEPFIYDVMKLLDLSMTSTYENINKYGLKYLLNKKFSSYGEKEIYSIVSKYEYKVELHNRNIINPYELDIYIPEKKLAIEFNGTYWHSECAKQNKYYHQNKTIECAKQGIRLIHIFEHEWVNSNQRKKLENLLNDSLRSNSVIHARNCIVQEVSKYESETFLNKYHLQGSTASEIRLGLYSNNQLVAVMTFGKPRFNNNYDYEIIRYCIMSGVYITGGAEKLFKSFIRQHKPKSIVTYVDISKFIGNVYTRLGFKPVNKPITEPSYVWANNSGECYSRYQTQKSRLVSKGLGTQLETEDTIMLRNGFMKIYNCGNLKLVYET